MTVSPEHGKRYNTRNGQVRGPMSRQECGHMGDVDGLVWLADGKYYYGKVSPLDLVSEYIEPTVETTWIEWHGGECPIKSDKTRVEARLFDGDTALRKGVKLDWSHCVPNYDGDIIAYRITEDHEPTDPAPIDMSQNRVQWGLLTDAEKAALRVWVKSGGKVKRLNTEAQVWFDAELSKIGMYPNMVYRTVSPPAITEERRDISTAAGHLVTVTLQLSDGKPISGTVVV